MASISAHFKRFYAFVALVWHVRSVWPLVLFTAMFGVDSDAADTPDRCDAGDIHRTDQDSQTVGSKRKAGRPVGDAWDTFKKEPNPNPGGSKRLWMGVCKFCD